MMMTPDQRKTLGLLSPTAITKSELIVPRGNLPEQLYAEIVSGDGAKLLVAGQRGMGKTTELIRLTTLLSESEFLPLFLQFGAQESVTQTSLLRAMAQSLYSNPKSKLEQKSFQQFEGWYEKEEAIFEFEEGKEGDARIGGSLAVLRAHGGIRSKRTKREKKTREKVKDVRDLIRQFNALLEKCRRACEKRIVFIVDDIDKVQDATSIENTFIHAAHFIGQIACPCIFTVPITYATSSFVRIAALPYAGIHRVPAVELSDKRGKPNAEAFEFMRKVFKLRMPFNPLTDDLLNQVLRNSGGVLVDAMRMLRGICKTVVLRGHPTAEQSAVDAEFLRLVDDYKYVFDKPVLWKKLSTFCKATDRQVIMTDDSLAELVYKMIVIEYSRDSLWFDLHPAARKLYELNATVIEESLKEL